MGTNQCVSLEKGSTKFQKKSLLFRGANLTHVVVLKPKQTGISNSSHAIVTYQKSEKNTDVQVRNSPFAFH